MVTAVTLGYRWEGLMLHQWAYTHTKLLTVVVPWNRIEMCDKIASWALWPGVPVLCQGFGDPQSFAGHLRAAGPDIVLCHCYSYKLPGEVLSVPRLGCVNIHPGKLPEYRGVRPIEDALVAGDDKLWVTLHYMDEEFDTGPVIAEWPVPRDDNILRMRSKLTRAGLTLLEQQWERITDGRT